MLASPFTVSNHPYIELAHRVEATAQSMQIEARELALLISQKTTRPLSSSETRRFETLCRRLDKKEKRLADYLAY